MAGEVNGTGDTGRPRSQWAGTETDTELVAHWRDRLSLQLQQRLQSLQDRAAHRDLRWVEDRVAFLKLVSIHDLLVGGLDPTKRRTFTARSLLAVRCADRGHLLARVHATRFLPVLVPHIGYPTIPGYDVRTEWDEEQTRENLTKDYGNAMDATLRSGWFCGYSDTDDDPNHAHIPGIFAIHPRDFHAESEDTWSNWFGPSYHWDEDDVEGSTPSDDEPDDDEVVGFRLLCRCGWRGVALAEVQRSLESGRSTIASPGPGVRFVAPAWYDALPYPYRFSYPASRPAL